MKTIENASRREFEKYWADGNHIFFDDKDEAWNLWQAARQQAIPSGWKSVPIEPTMERK